MTNKNSQKPNFAQRILNYISSHPWMSLLFGMPDKTIKSRHPKISKGYTFYATAVNLFIDFIIDLLIFAIFCGAFIILLPYMTKFDIVIFIWGVVTSVISNKFIQKIWHHIFNHHTKPTTKHEKIWKDFRSELYNIFGFIGAVFCLYLAVRCVVIILANPIIGVQISQYIRHLTMIISNVF